MSFPVVLKRRPPKARVKDYSTNICNRPELIVILVKLHPRKVDVGSNHISAVLSQAIKEVMILLELL
jgi:hypothetical protein